MMKRALWLRLDIGGIDLHFRISHYRKSTEEKWDTQWCEIDLTLQASNWLNYHISSSEIMLSLEVESLRDGIKALLNDELSEVDTHECIEPDFQFVLYPKQDVRNNPGVLYVKPGFEIADVDMEFVVTFWDRDGALSSNRLVLSFGRRELERLLLYLQLVTGLISENDEMITNMISEGSLYG